MPETDTKIETTAAGATDRPDTLQNAVDNLAQQLGRTGNSIGMLAARELAVAAKVAGDLRDTTLSEGTLKKARSNELIGTLRKTAHVVVDLGFDTAAVALQTATISVDAFIKAPR